MTAVRRGGPEPAPRQGPDAMPAHETLDASAARTMTLCSQRSVHPWTAVATTMIDMDPADRLEKTSVSDRPGLSGRERQA